MSTRVPVIIGCDPGLTTGLAFYRAGSCFAVQVPAAEVLAYLSGYLERHLDRYPDWPVEIAMEKFIHATGGAARTHQPEASEIIDQTAHMVRRFPGVTFYTQGAGDAKKPNPDSALRALGWYETSQPHANDATRHLLLRLLTRYPNVYMAVKAGQFKHLTMTIDEESAAWLTQILA